jgi:hypothetical protein
METKRKVPIKKILIVVLIIVLGLAAYLYWRLERGGPERVKETLGDFGPAVTVVPEVQPPTADRVSAVEDVCKENREKLQALFAYLDRQDYIASRRLKGGSFEFFKSLLDRLLEKPPSVLLETDSILYVLQNRAHFYRVLGKKDTLLIRDILSKEGDIMESSFAILYQAMTLQEKCKTDDPVLHVPLQKVYPYAVLFLNTLGGASYLVRRDSRVRMLTQYYCILILDQANRRRLNNLGLDIRPPLDVLMRDLKGAANLARKEEYLDTLKSIRAGY